MRPEQKSVAFMKDLLQKFSKYSNLMLEALATTLPIAKVCPLLDKHRRFVVFDKNSGCMCRKLLKISRLFILKNLPQSY